MQPIRCNEEVILSLGMCHFLLSLLSLEMDQLLHSFSWHALQKKAKKITISNHDIYLKVNVDKSNWH